MWGTLNDGEREARRALLNLIAEGEAPDPVALARALGTSPAEAGRLLEALMTKGFVVRNPPEGGVAAAYPLSVRPTQHQVILEDGRPVHALCAVDALGVSPLFGRGARIDSRCPHCHQPIRIVVDEGHVRRLEPAGAVVWYSMADLLDRRVEGLNLSAEH